MQACMLLGDYVLLVIDAVSRRVVLIEEEGATDLLKITLLTIIL